MQKIWWPPFLNYQLSHLPFTVCSDEKNTLKASALGDIVTVIKITIGLLLKGLFYDQMYQPPYLFSLSLTPSLVLGSPLKNTGKESTD